MPPMPAEPRRYSSHSQLAKLLGVAPRTLHQMRARRLIPPPIEFGPRCLRWPTEETLAAVAALPRATRTEPTQLASARMSEAATAT